MKFLVMLFSTLFVQPAWADLDKTLDAVQKAWDATTTYQAHFKQTIFSKRLGTKDEAVGTITVKRPGKLRWESDTDRTLQIINGKTMYHIHVNRRRKTAVVDIYEDISKKVDLQSLSFLAGTAAFKKNYTVEIAEDSKTLLSLRLKPKTSSGGASYIAEFSKSDYVLKSLTTESADSRVRVDFSDIKTNLELKDEVFEYKPGPKDVVNKMK